MIRSRPAPMPSVNTPSTSTLNGCGVDPVTTVQPRPSSPALTEPAGNAAGQSMACSSPPTGAATAGTADWLITNARNAPAHTATELRPLSPAQPNTIVRPSVWSASMQTDDRRYRSTVTPRAHIYVSLVFFW